MGKPIQRKQGNPQPKRSPKIKNKTVPLKAKSKDKVELTAAKTKAKNSVKSSLSKGRAKRDASDVVIHKSLPKGTSENGKGMKPQKGVRKGKTKATSEPRANSRAKNSLPEKFVLRKSEISGCSIGVFATDEVPLGSWFGPYEGTKIPVEEITKDMDMSYMWEILEDKEFKSVIDGKDEDISSWMRYINLARNDAEQNLCAFQYNDNVYYRSCKAISPNSELLVWYGKDFINELGACIFDSEESIPVGRHEKLIKIVMETANLNKDPGNKSSHGYPHFVDIDALPAADDDDVIKVEYISSDEDVGEPPSESVTPSNLRKRDKGQNSSVKSSRNKLTKKAKSTGAVSQTAKISFPSEARNKANKRIQPTNATTGEADPHFSIDISTKISKARKSSRNDKKSDATLSHSIENKGKKRKTSNVDDNEAETGLSPKTSNKGKKRKLETMNNSDNFQTKSRSHASSRKITGKNLKATVAKNRTNSPTKGQKMKGAVGNSKVQKNDMSIDAKNKRGEKRQSSAYENSNGTSRETRKLTKVKEKGRRSKVINYKEDDKDFDFGEDDDDYDANEDLDELDSDEDDFEFDEDDDVVPVGKGQKGSKGNKVDKGHNDEKDDKGKKGKKAGKETKKGEKDGKVKNKKGDKKDEEDNKGKKRKKGNKGDEMEDEDDESKIRIYKCQECGQILANPNCLRVHMRIHTDEKPFVCEECGLCFRQYSNLASHKVRHLKERVHQCSHCEKKFFTVKQLEAHVRTHTGETPFHCKECGKGFGRYSTLHLHKMTHNESKAHSCDQCDRKFDFPNQLKTHMRIHTREKPYSCDMCEKTFRRVGDLRLHKRTHTGEKPYECLECGKRFTASSDLRKHSRSHSGDRPYKCDQCGKTFLYSGNLASHLLSHTDEKPHACDQCHIRFRHKSDLKTHIRIHTGERPFKCDECEKSFNRKWLLTQHKRGHAGIKPYKCNECGKEFTYSSDLTKHAITHTGLRPFKCEKCRKTFTAAVSLKRHMMLHTGERPHECSFCGQRFRRRHHLRNHTNIYHSASTIKKEGEVTHLPRKPYRVRKQGNGEDAGEDYKPDIDKVKLRKRKLKKKKKAAMEYLGKPKVISPYKKAARMKYVDPNKVKVEKKEDIWEFDDEQRDVKIQRTKIKRKLEPVDGNDHGGGEHEKKYKGFSERNGKFKVKKKKPLKEKVAKRLNSCNGEEKLDAKGKPKDIWEFDEDGKEGISSKKKKKKSPIKKKVKGKSKREKALGDKQQFKKNVSSSLKKKKDGGREKGKKKIRESNEEAIQTTNETAEEIESTRDKNQSKQENIEKGLADEEGDGVVDTRQTERMNGVDVENMKRDEDTALGDNLQGKKNLLRSVKKRKESGKEKGKEKIRKGNEEAIKTTNETAEQLESTREEDQSKQEESEKVEKGSTDEDGEVVGDTSQTESMSDVEVINMQGDEQNKESKKVEHIEGIEKDQTDKKEKIVEDSPQAETVINAEANQDMQVDDLTRKNDEKADTDNKEKDQTEKEGTADKSTGQSNAMVEEDKADVVYDLGREERDTSKETMAEESAREDENVITDDKIRQLNDKEKELEQTGKEDMSVKGTKQLESENDIEKTQANQTYNEHREKSKTEEENMAEENTDGQSGSKTAINAGGDSMTVHKQRDEVATRRADEEEADSMSELKNDTTTRVVEQKVHESDDNVEDQTKNSSEKISEVRNGDEKVSKVAIVHKEQDNITPEHESTEQVGKKEDENQKNKTMQINSESSHEFSDNTTNDIIDESRNNEPIAEDRSFADEKFEVVSKNQKGDKVGGNTEETSDRLSDGDTEEVGGKSMTRVEGSDTAQEHEKTKAISDIEEAVEDNKTEAERNSVAEERKKDKDASESEGEIPMEQEHSCSEELVNNTTKSDGEHIIAKPRQDNLVQNPDGWDNGTNLNSGKDSTDVVEDLVDESAVQHKKDESISENIINRQSDGRKVELDKDTIHQSQIDKDSEIFELHTTSLSEEVMGLKITEVTGESKESCQESTEQNTVQEEEMDVDDVPQDRINGSETQSEDNLKNDVLTTEKRTTSVDKNKDKCQPEMDNENVESGHYISDQSHNSVERCINPGNENQKVIIVTNKSENQHIIETDKEDSIETEASESKGGPIVEHKSSSEHDLAENEDSLELSEDRKGSEKEGQIETKEIDTNSRNQRVPGDSTTQDENGSLCKSELENQTGLSYNRDTGSESIAAEETQQQDQRAVEIKTNLSIESKVEIGTVEFTSDGDEINQKATASTVCKEVNRMCEDEIIYGHKKDEDRKQSREKNKTGIDTAESNIEPIEMSAVASANIANVEKIREVNDKFEHGGGKGKEMSIPKDFYYEEDKHKNTLKDTINSGEKVAKDREVNESELKIISKDHLIQRDHKDKVKEMSNNTAEDHNVNQEGHSLLLLLDHNSSVEIDQEKKENDQVKDVSKTQLEGADFKKNIDNYEKEGHSSSETDVGSDKAITAGNQTEVISANIDTRVLTISMEVDDSESSLDKGAEEDKVSPLVKINDMIKNLTGVAEDSQFDERPSDFRLRETGCHLASIQNKEDFSVKNSREIGQDTNTQSDIQQSVTYYTDFDMETDDGASKGKDSSDSIKDSHDSREGISMEVDEKVPRKVQENVSVEVYEEDTRTMKAIGSVVKKFNDSALTNYGDETKMKDESGGQSKMGDENFPLTETMRNDRTDDLGTVKDDTKSNNNGLELVDNGKCGREDTVNKLPSNQSTGEQTDSVNTSKDQAGEGTTGKVDEQNTSKDQVDLNDSDIVDMLLESCIEGADNIFTENEGQGIKSSKNSNLKKERNIHDVVEESVNKVVSQADIEKTDGNFLVDSKTGMKREKMHESTTVTSNEEVTEKEKEKHSAGMTELNQTEMDVEDDNTTQAVNSLVRQSNNNFEVTNEDVSRTVHGAVKENDVLKTDKEHKGSSVIQGHDDPIVGKMVDTGNQDNSGHEMTELIDTRKGENKDSSCEIAELVRIQGSDGDVEKNQDNSYEITRFRDEQDIGIRQSYKITVEERTAADLVKGTDNTEHKGNDSKDEDSFDISGGDEDDVYVVIMEVDDEDEVGRE